MTTIAKKIRELSLYKRAALKFETEYQYVAAIAAGRRKPSRGKGLLIKNYLLEQLEKMSEVNNSVNN